MPSGKENPTTKCPNALSRVIFLSRPVSPEYGTGGKGTEETKRAPDIFSGKRKRPFYKSWGTEPASRVKKEIRLRRIYPEAGHKTDCLGPRNTNYIRPKSAGRAFSRRKGPAGAALHNNRYALLIKYFQPYLTLSPLQAPKPAKVRLRPFSAKTKQCSPA